MSPIQTRFQVVFFCLFASASSLISAVEPSAPYQIKKDDNLYSIAQLYLNNPEDWRAVAALNHIKDPLVLKIGRTIELPLSKLRGQKQSAQAIFLRGEVSIEQNKSSPQPLLLTTEIKEGALISTGPNGFVTLRLQDGSEVQLPANTQMQMQRLRHIAQINAKQTELKLKQGRLDLNVKPQNTGSRFDVRTPLAVTGVRGTHFGVTQADAKSASISEVTEGRVSFSSAAQQNSTVFLNAGQGGVLNAASNTLIVRDLLAAPTLAAENLLIQRSPMVLHFDLVADAQAYRIQIAKDTQFSEVLFSETVTETTVKISDLADGDYVLQIRGIDSDGVLGQIASAPLQIKTTPLAPLAQAPNQNEMVQTGSVELQCTQIPNAISYQLQYSPSDEFKLSETNTLTQNSCQFTVDIEHAGTYYWRVATLEKDPSGQIQRGPYSDNSRFFAIAALTAPEPQWTLNDTLQVHWVAHGASQFLTQVAQDKDFAQIVFSQIVSEPQVSFDLPAQCAPYFFRLQSINDQGLRSKFSNPRLISMDRVICSSTGPVRDGAGRAIRSKAR